MVLFYRDVRSCKIANCPQPIAGWITFWTSSVPLLQFEIVYKAALRLVYHGFAFKESYHFPSPRDQAALGLLILIRPSQSNTYSGLRRGSICPVLWKDQLFSFKNKERWLYLLRHQLQVWPCEYPLFCRLSMHNSSFISCYIRLLFYNKLWPFIMFY